MLRTLSLVDRCIKEMCVDKKETEREEEKQKQREIKDGYWNIQTDQEFS